MWPHLRATIELRGDREAATVDQQHVRAICHSHERMSEVSPLQSGANERLKRETRLSIVFHKDKVTHLTDIMIWKYEVVITYNC